MLRARWLIFLLAGWSVLASAAETAYVIDKLLVGVHRERDLNSSIIKVLPTGTALEVLERREQLARVKDAEGTEGWDADRLAALVSRDCLVGVVPAAKP